MSTRTQTRSVPKLEPLPAETTLTGLPLATVGLDAKQLSKRAPIDWSVLDSELGPVSTAVVRLADRAPRFALSSYRDAPWPSVTIAADESATDDDLDALLQALGVDHGELLDRVAAADASPAPLRAVSAGELAERIAARTELSTTVSRVVLNVMAEAFASGLVEQEMVRVRGLGTFTVDEQPQQPGKGAKARKRAAKRAVSFTPDPSLVKATS